MVLAVDGETLIKPLLDVLHAIVTLFLQCLAVSFNPALSSGSSKWEGQHDEHYDGDNVRERFSHRDLLLGRSMEAWFS